MGREEGRAVGRKEGEKSVAQKLKAIGMDAKSIAKVTGLTLDEIANLNTNLHDN